MILKRCPSCRGVADVERSPRCFACGVEIATAAPVLKRKRPPKALRIVAKDKKWSKVLLVICALVGGLATLAVIASDADPIPRILLGILFFGGIVLGIQSMRGRDTGTLGHVVLRLFAFAGMLVFGIIGLFLLLAIACAVGGL